MSAPANPPQREGAPGTVDERYKTAGLQLVMRLAATLRIGRAYQTDNQVFRQQLDGLQTVLSPILIESGEAVLVSLEEDLYFNGVRIPVKTSNFKFHRALLEEFKRRNIAGIRMQLGISDAELLTFFRLFLQPDLSGTALLAACLANGIDHAAPAIHASTEAPEDDFEYDAPLQWGVDASADDSGPTSGGRVGYGSGGGGGYGGGGGGGGYGGGGSGSGGGTGSGTGSGGGFGGSGGGEYGGGEHTPAEISAAERIAAEIAGVEPAAPAGKSPRGAAPKHYSQALRGARSLLTTTTLQDGLELRHGKRVVQPLVDNAFADEPVVVGLSSLTHKDEYTYAHAVNVCLVAVTMGKLLDMDRRALADLGVAALLHDVGKAVVADQIQHALDSFTDTERMAAERHPLEGAMLLARSTTLNQTTLRCMRVALEHHMATDGSGYPVASGRWPQSVMSRLVSVADCYVSLLGHRSERGSTTTPYEALGLMFGPLRKRFDPAMLWALVQTLGFYPPGQLVLLNDGSLAAVLAPNAADFARPHVRVIESVTGEALPQDKPREYRPLPPEMSIQRPLRADEYPDFKEADAA